MSNDSGWILVMRGIGTRESVPADKAIITNCREEPAEFNGFYRVMVNEVIGWTNSPRTAMQWPLHAGDTKAWMDDHWESMSLNVRVSR